MTDHAVPMSDPRGAEYRAAQAATTAPPPSSAVSWPAIFAGATATAALSLILLVLGTGLGLSSVSPWSGQGVSSTTFGAATIAWLLFAQIAAAGMGGYLAGRLRARWVAVHTDEVYFRDTAHGFLSWALAALVTAALLTTAIGNILGAGAKAGAAVATGAAGATAAAVPAVADATQRGDSATGYFVDMLLRQNAGGNGAAAAASAPKAGSDDRAATTAQAGRVLVSAMASGDLSADDRVYLGHLVARHTGLSQADAERRVANTFAQMQSKADQAQAAARTAADKARKASAYAALWLFVSLLVGAFSASLAATFGGRQRDHV